MDTQHVCKLTTSYMSTGTCYELWEEGCNGGCYVKGKLYFAQQLVFTQFLGHQLLYPAENYV